MTSPQYFCIEFEAVWRRKNPCSNQESAWLETEVVWVQASLASLCCVFRPDTFIRAYYWFNPGRHVQT